MNKHRTLLIVTADHDFEKAWNVYLKGYDDTEINSLADIIEFNKQHPDEALPPGKHFICVCQHLRNSFHGIFSSPQPRTSTGRS